MKPFRLALFMMLFPALGFADTLDHVFDQAQTAYDQGHYAEAALLYEGMLSNGVNNIEVHYNLADAQFKQGDLPHAIWHYRKAWYGAPRDPDILANLHFALNAAGAVEPSPSLPERVMANASQKEWLWIAGGSYLTICALMLLALWLRTVRPALLKLSLLPAIILLVALGAWWQWKQFRPHPEAVVVKSGTTALFAPMEGATAHYKIPQGALVRQNSTDSKGWVEVEHDGKKGWINQGHLLPLYP